MDDETGRASSQPGICTNVRMQEVAGQQTLKRCYHVLFPALAPIPQSPGSVSTPKSHRCAACRCCYAVDCLIAVVGVGVHQRLSIPPPHLGSNHVCPQNGPLSAILLCCNGLLCSTQTCRCLPRKSKHAITQASVECSKPLFPPPSLPATPPAPRRHRPRTSLKAYSVTMHSRQLQNRLSKSAYRSYIVRMTLVVSSLMHTYFNATRGSNSI